MFHFPRIHLLYSIRHWSLTNHTGVGSPKVAEKVEKRMVEREESSHLSAAGNITAEDGWDAAWDSENENDKTTDQPPATMRRHRSSLDEERAIVESPLPVPVDHIDDNEDGGADEWGWGDEDNGEGNNASADINPEPTPAMTPEPSVGANGHLREVTIVEKYWTSSMPQPVLQTVIGMYEDAASLTQEK